MSENYVEAIFRYEEAIGLFCYCRTTDPEWRTNGLDDDTIVDVSMILYLFVLCFAESGM